MCLNTTLTKIEADQFLEDHSSCAVPSKQITRTNASAHWAFTDVFIHTEEDVKTMLTSMGMTEQAHVEALTRLRTEHLFNSAKRRS